MQPRRLNRFLRLGLALLLGLPALGHAAQAQREKAELLAAPAADAACVTCSSPTAFSGCVFGPDGANSAGVVVITSAGGRAVTDAQGRFSLVVDVPDDAQAVQVTAVASASASGLTASARVGGLVRHGTTAVPPLVLAASASCEPSWFPTFGGKPGVKGRIEAFAVFDDGRGGGPQLYVGGEFIAAGSVLVNNIASWNGSAWSPLGGGLNDDVSSLAVFDDGGAGGPALFVGGLFTSAGGVPAKRIAKWDGASWSAVGGGVDNAFFGPLPEVSALAVFDDGGVGGPALYAGGYFTTAGPVVANFIAKWDGAAWSSPGSGMSGRVDALTVFDEGPGDGPRLIAGGSFTVASGVPANRIARWNGTSWSALGSGTSGRISALAVLDDGTGGGPALYAGGSFGIAGEVSANSVAKWDGSTWSSLDSGFLGAVESLAAFDDGSGGGPALYAGGPFTSTGAGAELNRIAKWNGASWSALGNGTSDSVHALAVFDDGRGPLLCAGGNFATADGATVNSAAAWNGQGWSPLGSGLSGAVRALAVFDDGSGGGPALFVGGEFLSVGTVPVLNRIAKWDGSAWSPLGSGTNGTVETLAVFDDGSTGPKLYVGGEFTIAGGVSASRIAAWDGANWSALGAGLTLAHPLNDIPTSALCLTVFDDLSGNGPKLYVGGAFQYAGGKLVNNVARWNGTAWSKLGVGTYIQEVRALTGFDDGSGDGPALIAGGDFEKIGGLTVHKIGKWDGTSWSALGSGVTTRVDALAVFDDGSGGGPQLHAGGIIYSAPGVANVVRWNGTSWLPLGSGIGFLVEALTVIDDGTGGGPALFAGGSFTTADGVAANRVAKWNGSSWSALGSGTNGDVLALAEFDDGSGPALYAGGSFDGAIATGDSYLAKWGGCSPSPGEWAKLGFALAGTGGLPQLTGTGALIAGQPVSIQLSQAKPASLAALFVGLSSTPTPFKGGTLVPVPVLLSLSLVTSAAGTVLLPVTWPGGLPSAFSLYFQYGIQDEAAAQGVALSNALRATTP